MESSWSHRKLQFWSITTYQLRSSSLENFQPILKRQAGFSPCCIKMLSNSHFNQHSCLCKPMENSWIYLKSNHEAAQNSSCVGITTQGNGEKRYSWIVLAADKTIQGYDKNITTYYYSCLEIAFAWRQFMFYFNNMLWVNKIKYILGWLVWFWGNYSQELSNILSQIFCCYFLLVLSGLRVVIRSSIIHSKYI